MDSTCAMFLTDLLQRKVIEIALRGQGAAVCGRVADFQAHVDGLALVT